MGREKRKNDISMTLNGSRDRENRVGSPTIREKDESKFAGELEGVRLKEETDKHHLSTVSSVDGERKMEMEEKAVGDGEKIVINDWTQLWNDHYNQVNWAEYYRFSEMFYAYGRYDDHPSAGEYRDYSYDDRGYHEEPYEGKKR